MIANTERVKIILLFKKYFSNIMKLFDGELRISNTNKIVKNPKKYVKYSFFIILITTLLGFLAFIYYNIIYYNK